MENVQITASSPVAMEGETVENIGKRKRGRKMLSAGAITAIVLGSLTGLAAIFGITAACVSAKTSSRGYTDASNNPSYGGSVPSGDGGFLFSSVSPGRD